MAYAADSHRLMSVTEDSITDGSGVRQFTYDGMGNTVTDLRADGTLITLTHDVFGRLSTVTQHLPGQWDNEYPAIDAGQVIGSYGYDGFDATI